MKNNSLSQKMQEPVALTEASATEIFLQAGRIVMSERVGESMRELRRQFNLRQTEVAKRLNITASVVSDYEKGRRPSPGAHFIRDYILACNGLEVMGKHKA